MSLGSCTKTRREKYPWWKVTFKYYVLVKEVIIVNRGDCCGKYLDDVIFPHLFLAVRVLPQTHVLPTVEAL